MFWLHPMEDSTLWEKLVEMVKAKGVNDPLVMQFISDVADQGNNDSDSAMFLARALILQSAQLSGAPLSLIMKIIDSPTFQVGQNHATKEVWIKTPPMNFDLQDVEKKEEWVGLSFPEVISRLVPYISKSMGYDDKQDGFDSSKKILH